MVDRFLTASKTITQLLANGGNGYLIGAIMGDSITVNNGGNRSGTNSIQWNNNGYATWLRILSRQRVIIPPGYNRSTGGFSMADIATTHLPQVLALSPKPDFTILYGGTNSAGNIRTDTTNIIKQLSEAGILPVILAVQPAGSDAGIRRGQSDYNTWLKECSRGAIALRAASGFNDQHQFLVVDAGRYINDFSVSPTIPLVGMKQDGLHPSAAEAFLTGRELWTVMKQALHMYDIQMQPDTYDAFSPAVSPAIPGDLSTSVSGSLLSVPTLSYMFGTGGTRSSDIVAGQTLTNNGIATGLDYRRWAGNSTCTTVLSKVAKEDPAANGSRQQIAITGITQAATSPAAFDNHQFQVNIPAANVSVGDWYQAEVDYEVIGTPIGLRAVLLTFDGGLDGADTGKNLFQTPHKGTLRTPPVQCQSAASKYILFNIYMDTTVSGGQATIAFDRFVARKVGGSQG